MLKTYTKMVAAGLSLFILAGCAHHEPPCIGKDGKMIYRGSGKIFTHEWYDYYERAVSYMENECYPQAMSDLKNAINDRPDDKRMAKIYGVRLTDYFPHREKGLIHYLTGEYDLAKTELELSMKYEKTDKALHYLDKTRKHLLEKAGIPVSMPRFASNIPADTEIWTREVPVMISGVVEDTQYVSEILINDNKAFLERSGDESDLRIGFAEPVSLVEGTNMIDITARNIRKGTSVRQIMVHVDRTGPIIELQRIETDRLHGYAYDESGEIFLSMNGEKVAIPKGKEAEFSVTLSPNTGQIRLTAEDKLGNQTKAEFDLSAALSSNKTGNGSEWDGLLADSFLIMRDDGQSFSTVKNEIPEIRIDELTDGKTVVSETYSVKGQIRASDEVKTVSVNNTPLNKKPGRIISFNHPVALKLGKNPITIRASDSKGRENTKTFSINRETPEPLKLKYRCMLVADTFKMMLSSDYLSGTTDVAATMFQHKLLNRLIESNRFRIGIPEESKKLLETESPNPKSGSIANSDAKSSAERLLLSGYFHKTRNGLEIIARVTNLRTGEYQILDVYEESGMTEEESFSTLMGKFEEAFPLIIGKIFEKQGEKLFVASEKVNRMKWLMDWSLIVGSDIRIAGYARMMKKMDGGNYLIEPVRDRFYLPDWFKPNGYGVGDLVVAQ